MKIKYTFNFFDSVCVYSFMRANRQYLQRVIIVNVREDNNYATYSYFLFLIPTSFPDIYCMRLKDTVKVRYSPILIYKYGHCTDNLV